MAGRNLLLPWGKEELQLSLPEDWHVAGRLEPASLPSVKDVADEIYRSLQSPISCPRLRGLARPGMKVALVIDDISRPTPVALIFPAVLGELEHGGVGREAVTLITALGVHRLMREEEKVSLVRRELAGCIEPHIIAGFGGGYKNLLPSVTGRETIAHNHTLNCTPDTFNMVGQPIERNPMRLDLEEGAQMLKQPVFIVNAVLDSALHIVRIVSGTQLPRIAKGCSPAPGCMVYRCRLRPTW